MTYLLMAYIRCRTVAAPFNTNRPCRWRDTPNDEKGALAFGVGGGGSDYALVGNFGAIAEGRTHPTSVYFQGNSLKADYK